MREIKKRLGGTVNDVVLARRRRRAPRFLIERATSTPTTLELRAMVPVSVRPATARHLGNQIAAVGDAATDRRHRPGRAARGGLRGGWTGSRLRSRRSGRRCSPRSATGPCRRCSLASRLTSRPGVEPGRHQRARAAVPALPARAPAPRRVPDRLPAREPHARGRDHVLRRRDQLRAARRSRFDGGHRGDRRSSRKPRSPRYCGPRERPPRPVRGPSRRGRRGPAREPRTSPGERRPCGTPPGADNGRRE